MRLTQQIDVDLGESMKSKDELKTSVLRMLKSALKNWQIANKKEPQDADILQVIQKEIKSRKDSIAMYKQGGREELAEKEKSEVEILQNYLPEQLSEDEIREKIKEVISSTGATGPQDMGKVMGPIMAEFKGKADGTTVSQIVKEELSR
ncbi:MAG: hypothetical protein HW405_940 [Candidatus Berkelbacteria bacterium]|nr:hypothetical protein [Candidatus Berkelbacteria bacterium]